MSQQFRLPLPEKLGASMSATIPNFRPPKSKQFDDNQVLRIYISTVFGQIFMLFRSHRPKFSAFLCKYAFDYTILQYSVTTILAFNGLC
jgi:hypothetical protein